MLKQKMMKVALCGAIATSIGTGVGIADNNKVHAAAVDKTTTEAIDYLAENYENIKRIINRFDKAKVLEAERENLLKMVLNNIVIDFKNKNQDFNVILIQKDMYCHFYDKYFKGAQEIHNLQGVNIASRDYTIGGEQYKLYVFDRALDFYVEKDANDTLLRKLGKMGGKFEFGSIVAHTDATSVAVNGEYAYHFDVKKGNNRWGNGFKGN